jgi:hypothetical protein
MKNHSVRIIHAQQTLSPAFHTRGFSMDNLQFDLKHLVAINSLASNMFSSLGRFIINLICSACPPVIEPGLNSFHSFPFANPVGSEPLPLCIRSKHCAQSIPWSPMAASQSTGKGTHGAENCEVRTPKRLEFFLTHGDHSQRRGRNHSFTYRRDQIKSQNNRSREIHTGKGDGKSPSSQQQLPRRRGRPRKNEEIMKAQIPEGPCVRLIAEELLRRAIRLEPAGKSSHEGREQSKESGRHGRK